MDLRLATKPGHLPLGIIAVSLLSGLQCLLPREFPAKKLHGLFVSERRERTRGTAVLLKQTLRLFHQSNFKHLLRAAIDSLIQRLTIGIET